MLFRNKTNSLSLSLSVFRIVGVIDLEAFQHGTTLILRELGLATVPLMVTYNYQILSDVEFPLDDQSIMRSFEFQRFNVHGLPYEPSTCCSDGDNIIEEFDVGNHILNFYNQRNNQLMTTGLLAYKGGCLERNLLSELNIPSFNLEEIFDCPQMGILSDRDPFVQTYQCYNHISFNRGFLHCATLESAFYAKWVSEKLLSIV